MLLQEWVDHLKQHNVPHSDDTCLIKTLQDPVKVRAPRARGPMRVGIAARCTHVCVCT